MHDITITLSKLFELSNEAVVAVSGGEIIYKNPAAYALLPGDGGKSAQALLPTHLLEQSCESFVTSAYISGRQATVTATSLENVLVLTFKFDDEQDESGLCVSSEVFASLRSEMFNLKLAADQFMGKPKALEDAKQRVYASVLYHSYYSLLRLLGNLDTANSLSRGELTIQKRPTDVVRLCGELVDSVYHFLLDEEINILFETELSSFVAEVDGGRIEQLLLNLISNSIKHTGKGGTIRLSLKPSGENFILSLNDSGSGISPEVLSCLFTRYREKRPLSELSEGLGLGLFIAKGIAERHGGALIFESRDTKGAHAHVMLPVGRVDGILSEPSTPYGGGMQHILLTEISGIFGADKYETKYLD